jgi:hypothetical protein
MGNKYHAFVILVIISLPPAISEGKKDSAETEQTERTLQTIQNCMARSPGEWPDEWRQEYLETIRSAVESHRDAGHYALRLEILREGFEIEGVF